MKVNSSVINNVYYNDSNGEMIIEFWNGDVYCYEDIPKSLYEVFIESESIGKFFHLNVKNKFHFKKEN